MACPKKILFAVISLFVAVGLLFPNPALAFQKQYFDYGPYYSNPQVLGLSSLENLPVPTVPDNLMPAPAQGILPGNPFYTLERGWENAQLAFTFNPIAREQLRLRIAEERLSEAKTLMDQGKIQAASQALGEYGKAVQAIADNLHKITQTNAPASQDLINKVEEAAASQAVVATVLSLSTPPAQAENWTEAVNHNREILDKVAESRGEPAIPEELSNSLQQLKQQGLISEEESNKIYSLKSRSEVREELVKLHSAGGLPPSEIARLDEGLAKYYPQVQDQQIANWQVVELRSYQAQTQPTEEQIEELEKWQDNPNIPPSNNIKPYLWYNRASALAKEVDLSHFSQNQQADLSKYYPETQENPSFSPSPESSGANTNPSPAPTADQTASPSPAATAVPSPSATPVPADPYLQDPGTLPGQPTYILKQLGEGLDLALTFDPAEKAKLKFEHAEQRLAEAAALSKDPKKTKSYESTLQDYQQTLADASNLVKNLPEGKEAKRAAEKLEAQAARHEVIFEKGLLPIPSKDPELLAEVIKTTEDALDTSADVLDRPSVPPALASRLDDLKAQGLILEEEAQNLINSESRADTRKRIRELVEQKGFPLADAKKMDEAQSKASPADYNQLVEVRKVEELQSLRAVQTDLAQTPTLKAQATALDQKTAALTASFDPALIKKEDLGGSENLVKIYEELASTPRPINSGQFGGEATPGAKLTIATPSRQDAVLTTCPEGATFKQFEGCVWADTGKSINDYDQYKCEGPRQYYSFAAGKCVPYEPGKGFGEDSQPICPVSYVWSWQTQSCQASTGSILPYPSPSTEPEPKDDKEREERSKNCPEGSSYQAPNGCVWDSNGKSVYDSEQYRCRGRGQYYSFEQQKCVTAPQEGEPYLKDATPACKEEGAYWNWSQGRCLKPDKPAEQEIKINIDEFKPPFIAADSPFYIIKQAAERTQLAFAFSASARSRIALDQAKERLDEAANALKEGDQALFSKAIDTYTSTMQSIVSDTSKQQLTEGARKEIGEMLSEAGAEQNLLLEKLQAWAPKELDTALSAAVSVSILGVDKAADIAGEPPIPDEVKNKIEALPEQMVTEEAKEKLLSINSRVDARLQLGSLITNGTLTQTEASFLNEDFDNVDQNAKIQVEELKKLEQIAAATESKEELTQKVEKNEEIVQKLAEFEKTFEAGKEVPAEIRPYVRLTRINEVAQTVRPDIVKLEDFQNRKDVLLAVATLQEEFKPTQESWRKVEDYRRKNPGTSLPPELARIEALSFSLGVRNQAEPCYLPTPPFAQNTPCPATGAAIPIVSYATYNVTPTYTAAPTTDKDGKALIYGQGPKTEKSGVCPNGYHWMYDSGGWCMSNSGNYSSSYNYTPAGPQTSGYTPYSSYYNAPGVPPATYGYPAGDFSYAASASYSAPSYYGPASTSYTTNPPAGTVPGSGPKPTAPGRCPSGFHWMSDSNGWCMADGPTYTPGAYSSYAPGTTTTGTPPSGGYNCGSQSFDPSTGKCKDGACPGGFNWDGSKCVAPSPNLNQSSCGPGYYWSNGSCFPNTSSSGGGGGSTPWCWSASPPAGGWGSSCGSGYSWDASTCSCRPSSSVYTPTSSTSYPSSYQYGCTPGYYWNGSRCVAGSNEGSGWSDTTARTQSWCQPPSAGCGSGKYWDYGSCYCRSSNTYSGGGGPSPSNQCQGISCGGGAWLDYSTCTCKYSGTSSSGTGSSGSPITCYPPPQGCPGGWYDYGTCSCKSSSYSSSGTTTGGSYSGGSYSGSGSYTTPTYSGGSSTSGSGSSGSLSCPTGYHPMDNSWCMSDAARDGGSSGSSGGGTSTTSTPAPAPTNTPSTPTSTNSEPAPAPAAPASEPAPAPPSEPAPAPAAPASEPAPAP